MNAELKGKRIAVTGATGGLGRALCERLAEAGAHVLLVCRSDARAAALEADLRHKFPDVKTEILLADLTDERSVVLLCEELQTRELDGLVLNAGAYAIERSRTAADLDNVYQINAVAPYYIARELLPSLCKRGGRVVAVSSLALAFSTTDVATETEKKPMKAYGNAKRRLTFSLFRLFARSGYAEGLSVVHPGISPTGITSHYPKILRALVWLPMRLLFHSPKKASRCLLAGLTRDGAEGEWFAPRFLGIRGKPVKRKLKGYRIEEAEKAFSEMQADVTRFDFFRQSR